MSRPDGFASRLGQSADWGLTESSFAPLRDELSDHLHCLDEGGGADTPDCSSEEIAARLASPAARRKLTATRIADQVYATLHRWPKRREWREFGWLLCWYVLIVLSDFLSINAVRLGSPFMVYNAEPTVPPAPQQILLWGAWILQGVARAGFFTAFGLSLYHAWMIGWGVLIARILQLKLVHTVLVICAGLLLGGHLANFGNWFNSYIFYGGPAWLTAPFISIWLLYCALAMLVRSELRPLAAFFLLLALFLYWGGPLVSRTARLESTWVKGTKLLKLEDGQLRPGLIAIADDGSVIAKSPPEQLSGKKVVAELPNDVANRTLYYEQWQARMAERYPTGSSYALPEIDPVRNTYAQRFERLDTRAPGHIKYWKDRRFSSGTSNEWEKKREARLEAAIAISPGRLQGPVVAPGAGLAWLAAPVPFLGAIGLLALLGLMGRRGVVDFVIYTLLAGAAMLATITPFLVGQSDRELFHFNPLGMIKSPFPGFENLMIVSLHDVATDYLAATLLLGLLMSAGIPWLLAAMFLKPESARNAASGPEVAA